MKRSLAAVFLAVPTLVCSLIASAQSPMAHTVPAGDYPAHVGHGGISDHLDEIGFRRSPPFLSSEPRVIKDGPLAPSRRDRAAFTSLLKEKNTGLIRLLPRESVERRTKRARVGFLFSNTLGGPYFSFAQRTHRYGYGSDLGLEQNNLSVGFAGADFGMMTNMGDTPLQKLTVDDWRVREINAYRPPKPELEARSEYRRSSSPEGMNFDGYVYRKQVPVQENSTYLLRSISYDRSDVLVAFRLVRKDTDGSVIIAWKLLKRYPTPDLKRNK